MDTGHAMGWNEVKVVCNETNKYTRWAKEVIQIRKTGAANLNHVNRDEGQYFLTHIFDDLLKGKKQTGKTKSSAASVRGYSQ